MEKLMKKILFFGAIITAIVVYYINGYLGERELEGEYDMVFAVITDMDDYSMTVRVVNKIYSFEDKNSKKKLEHEEFTAGGKKYKRLLYVSDPSEYSKSYKGFFYLDTKGFVNYKWKDASASRKEFEVGNSVILYLKKDTFKDCNGSDNEKNLSNSTLDKKSIKEIALISN